ncbi:MAG: Na+:solute symporter [Bacteroidales bacterium]|nr:Na+:solute symporter [Bacteroidales bacterium]
MNLVIVDWLIIGVYFIISLGIGLLMSKRAGKGMDDFFLSGRKLPWYIAGTSMVATTFAADTPLAVTELVAQNGIAGNWLWWNMLFGGMLTVFFFARLWRRSGILTDAEFVSIRYSGRPANFLRGFRAVYIGIVMNTIVIAWVNLAMVKILKVLFPEFTVFGAQEFSFLGIEFSSHLIAVAGLMLFTTVYSALSGLWGISLTDSFQFIIAMTGSIILAVFAVNHIDVGGIQGLKEKLPEWSFDFFPDITSGSPESDGASGILKMTVTAFVAYLGVQWWSSWYPGAEPGGGGYIAQRMMSAKNEKHSVLATLWFQIAHYALRPWPWIIAAFAALILYPDAADKGSSYVMLIRDLLPAGLLGLLFAAFLAAYMSTIASQTVWGTSYIVNDLYKPFINKDAGEKKYIKISRITTFILMAFSLIITTQFDRISDAWKFVIVMSAGIGLVLLLRWFWWRINAWSEISAMIAPYIIYPVLTFGFDLDVIQKDFEISLIIIVIWSTIVWLSVTFLTKPEKKSKLKSFYKKVHPGGRGWRKISVEMPEVKSDTGFGRMFFNWFAGSLMVMSALFGIGKIIFAEYIAGFSFVALSIALGFIISYNLSKLESEE